MIVIGAGINGAAIAREAALSGLRVLLVERGDVGCGTSSASSRLIHGGLRYLEHAELTLVRESLRERERLLRLAPHLVAPLELFIPIYSGARRGRLQISLGLTLYDWLSFDRSLPGHSSLTRDELLERVPALAPDGLVGGASYFDAQARFPERLVIENVRDAVDHGAGLETYARVTRVIVEAGRAAGVEWRSEAGERRIARAPLVVNAAGPWVDEVLGEIRHTRLIGGTKGSHLVVPSFPGAPRAGIYVEAGSDGRPFFILPWNGLLLVGTTDERFDGDPGAAEIGPHELDYLARETARVLPAAAGLERGVLYTQTGVRPLPYEPRGAEGAITRRHLIRRHRSATGLYSIVGGKLTTHRALAEDVLDVLRRHVARPVPRSPTRDRPLPGALPRKDWDALLADASAAFGAAHAARLLSVYGAGTREILGIAARDRTLRAALGAGRLIAAELVYGIEREWARTLGDLLLRRTMAGLDADFGLGVAEPAAESLVRIGVWDAARADLELAEYRAHAARQHAAALSRGRS